MTRAEIPTPALLLDLDRFERNVAKMAAHVKAAGKKIRPHAKTHKCPEIARRQVAAGAVGVCVAKVGEAEVMAAAGVRNLLITTEVVGPEKIGRLLGVLRRQPETLVVVDNPDNVRELGDAVARAGLVLNVLVDVDVGGRRTGIQPGESARDLGRQLPPGLEYVDSWVDLDYARCFQLMRTEDRSLFDTWTKAWADLCHFEIIPVRTSAETARSLADRLSAADST